MASKPCIELKVIYDGLVKAGCEYPPFQEWLETIMMTFLNEDGGFVFTADSQDLTSWKTQAWFSKPGLKISDIKGVMRACMAAGCKMLVATATNPRMSVLLERLRWQQVEAGEPKVYAIRCE